MPSSLSANDHVFLVDGSSFIFRAYFQSIRQDQKYNYRADRLPSGAVRLFCTKMLQFVREGAAGEKPTHLAIIFDKSENSLRKEIYPEYKAHRSEPPEDLVWQFPLMRHAVRAFGLTPIEQDKYEADDLIATYARQAKEQGAKVLIISSDKDLMHLIGEGVSMYDPASGAREERYITQQEVFDYFGVPPEQVVDVQSLAGDSTDNIPGAPGIGIKTAAQLIQEYGSLETLLARANEIKQPKRRESLTLPENVARIKLSQQLVRLYDDVPLDTPLEDLRLENVDPKPLIAFMKAMEFSTLTKRVGDIYEMDISQVDPDPTLLGPKGWQSRNGTSPPESMQANTIEQEGDVSQPTPQSLAQEWAQKMRALPIEHTKYERVQTPLQLEQWIARIKEAGVFAIDTETSSLDPMQADLIGISLCTQPGEACYIPLGHRTAGAVSLFEQNTRVPDQLEEADVLAQLKPLLEDEGLLKIGQNLKFDAQIFQCRGITIKAYDDTMLISYVLEAGLHGHGMDELSLLYLEHRPIAFKDLIGEDGKKIKNFADLAIGRAVEYAAEDADVTLRLWHVFKPRLVAEGILHVYESLERPMVRVLTDMEQRGILINRAILAKLSGDFAQEMTRGEAEIHELAGEAFNLASPKQLGDILFGKMGLKGGKKTPTGAWSTSASVLEDLAEEGSAFAAKLLEWRQLAKLKSTYTDALPEYIHPKTGRVHTSFALAATTTGRLSSSEPNVQNIPVRNPLGRRIRAAFVAGPEHKLISADYSQIELRLLAHVADIPQLQTAFSNGDDIHAMTASEIFNVPLAEMTSEIRRRAKAINFGIIYGISAFGLANQLGIAREEAGGIIKRYFERFPGIKDYMEATKQQCRDKGYVTTLFGRKCHYPKITSSNASERAFNERAAINAPLQGSAADIIRRAMCRMDEALSEAGLDARMLLQVHDELVFEAPDAQIEATKALVKKIMQEAPLPVVTLKVPLVVDANAAQNWDEAH